VDELKKGWLTLVVSGTISLMVCLIMWSLTNKRADSQELKSELSKKASLDYVNAQDQLIRADIDKNGKEHELIIKILLEKQKEDRYNFEEIRNQLYKK